MPRADERVMDGSCPPTAAALANVLIARARARLAVRAADDDYAALLWSAFRTEIGAGVARVSPLLLALLADEGLSLDDLVWMISPGRGWPFQPLSAPRRVPQAHRGAPYGEARALRPSSNAGVGIGVRHGGRVRVQIVDDSIEMVGRIGTVHASTGGCLARLTVRGCVSGNVAAAAIGRPAANVVDLPFLAGRDWQVVTVERSSSTGRSSFVVEVGSRPYVMPWVRPP